MTTQSEPRGTQLTDIEIYLGGTRATYATIRGLTGDGRVWLHKHMVDVNHNGMVKVARDTVDETIQFIKSSGLKVVVA